MYVSCALSKETICETYTRTTVRYSTDYRRTYTCRMLPRIFLCDLPTTDMRGKAIRRMVRVTVQTRVALRTTHIPESHPILRKVLQKVQPTYCFSSCPGEPAWGFTVTENKTQRDRTFHSIYVTDVCYGHEHAY